MIRIMRFGYPYQYNQAPLRKQLWTINTAIRLGLSKILPGLFSPPSFFMVQDHRISYTEVFNGVGLSVLYMGVYVVSHLY
jgi:kynurenine 3-monooxygenase